jgi:hypothetical protein
MKTALARAIRNHAAGICLTLGLMGSASAALIGPNPYLSAADSPFAPFSGFSYFHLEDFEDGLFNAPGVTATGSGLCVVNVSCFVNAGLTDSVENGQAGHDHWASGSITYTFSAALLGALPDAVGVVWTDGVNSIRFEAFDENGVSLGVLVGNHADGNFLGDKAEDRFYGVTHSGGISRIVISNPGGIEVDHLQYGLRAATVSEPATLGFISLIAVLAIGRRRRNGRPPAP